METPGLQSKSAVSWAFDVAVMAMGLGLGLAALVGLLRGAEFDGYWASALLLATPIAALMSRFPLVLSRSSTGIEVGFDSAVLVFLACFDRGHGALAVWALSAVLAQTIARKRPDTRLFNIGLAITSGAAALATMRAISPLDETSPQALMAVGAGCAVYFVVDYLLSALSVAMEEDTSIVAELKQGTGLAALGVFVAIDSLGYLAAVVVRELDDWVAGLLAVPLFTILVATRALSRGFEHRRRLEALFAAAAEAQVVQSREALEELLSRNARAAVGDRQTELRLEDPKAKEIGARVRTGAGDWWLVTPARHRARASIEADQMALEALATVGEEAFARLSLTAEMAHLARHDALTSLPNRTLFLDRVEQAVLRGRRTGGTLAVLFLDLDGFKEVNDRFGHAEGDELLKAVAERLVGCVRTADSVARLGGDEFAVLLEGIGGGGELETICERLLLALRAEIPIMGHQVVVGTSIGVAVADPADDAAGLLRNADMAMYRAKALGKNRYFLYQPALREQNVQRLELIEALRHGIDDGLVVHYQPVVNLVSGVVEGLEALVRWRRDGKLVMPDAFISAAEESGLIGDVGARVLEFVVADAPAIEAAAGRPVMLGVNMSAHQLRDPGFVGLVGEAVRALGRNTLVLEMTESVVVADDADTLRALNSLKALGTKLSIDDFGVGFSSIAYLQHLPVDSLKIDRSFTSDADTNPRAAALVEAILVMAAALGLRVVAEGIERVQQLDKLRRVGCALGQGYLLGRPQEFATLVPLLQAGLPAKLMADVPAALA